MVEEAQLDPEMNSSPDAGKDETRAEISTEDRNDPQAEHSSEASSSSDSDSEEDEAESLQRAQLEELETAVVQNPCNYQAHVEYINLLRKCGLLEKLRSAREAMSKLFPLNPTMWSEWTQDECRLISSPGDIIATEALYERALQEYLSVPLWIEFLEFKQQHDLSVAQFTHDGLSKMRAVFERALTAAGLHFAEGGKVWMAYRGFEQAVLANVLADSATEVKDKQVDTIRNLFRRQLSVPLPDVAKTLREYKEWERQQGNELAGIPAHIIASYRKAKQMCNERQVYEEKVARGKPADPELLQNFLSYISFEETTGDPARVQVLYERAVAEFPVTEDLWLKYTDYLEKNLKVSSIIRSVYAKAVHNCPWVQGLWDRYLLALERSNVSEPEISVVFEKSLQTGFPFSTPLEYLKLFLTRADGLRRRVTSLTDNTEKQQCLTTLRETFDRASQFLSVYFPDFVDRSLRLHSYWARLEAQLANDVTAARGVWENLIKSRGWLFEVWHGYILMELALNNVKEARSIYKRCYSRKLEGNGTEMICDAWLWFEREYGSLEDYDRALKKVVPRLAEVSMMQQQQDNKLTVVNDLVGSKPVKPKAERGVKDASANVANTQASKAVKRSLEQVGVSLASKAKKKAKTSVSEAANAHQEAKAGAKKHESMDNAMADKDTVLMEEDQEEDKQAQMTPESGSKKQAIYTDECTAFVSNLAFEVTEEDLQKFFSSCGSVKEVRLLRKRFDGRPRGLAYIDFENEEGLIAAISKNREKLMGRPVSIARSDPTGGRKSGASNKEQSHGARHLDYQSQEEMEAAISNSVPREVTGIIGQHERTITKHRRGGHVELSGRKNTFAIPRTVARPLGFSSGQGQPATSEDIPKSNEEFRKMLLKS